MPSSWPTSIDNFGHVTGSEITGSPNGSGLTHSGLHNLLADAVTQLETVLQHPSSLIGETPSGATPNNLALGYGALGITSVGGTDGRPASYDNIAIGYQALFVDASPTDNVAIGYQAMQNTSQIYWDVAIGTQALQNDLGGSNIAIGYQAAQHLNNVNAYNNITLGAQAMGGHNVYNSIAIGPYAMQTADNGVASDIAIGNSALFRDLTGNNVGIGYNAMAGSAGGTSTVAIGNNALNNAATPNYTVAIGTNAIVNSTFGSMNHVVAIGYNALGTTSTTGYDIAIGSQALSKSTLDLTAITPNIAIGYAAMQNGPGNYNNIGIGTTTLQNLTTGQGNVAIGNLAMRSTTTGTGNVVIGPSAGQGIIGGTNNVAVGFNAVTNNVSDDIGIGHNALLNDTGGSNIAIGSLALSTNSIGTNNIAIGYQANQSMSGNNYTTAIGSGTSVTANGAVAIGVDSTGIGATAATPNYIVLGTASHTIKVKTPTTTTATAGTNTLPANPAVFLPIDVGGIMYKLPLYNV